MEAADSDDFAVETTPSEFVEFAFVLPTNDGLKPFSFKGRRYLRKIYDSKAKRKIIIAGRQTEKTVTVQSVITEANGNLKAAADVRVGDSLASMDHDGAHMTFGKVDWVSRWYTKPCLRITTRQGHIFQVHTEHPVRTWNAWTDAKDLKVGGKVAAVRDGNTVLDFTNPEDLLPVGANQDLVEIFRSGLPVPGSRYGLSPRRGITYGELDEYISGVRDKGGFNQDLVNQLAAHLNTDLYWDEIVSIEDIGNQLCIDFRVEDTHNFVTDGVITHNSTYLGNICLSYAAMVSGFKVLYVSPSHTQTKVFSRDRIKEPIDISQVLGSLTNSKLLTNVLERKFSNRSLITLRFAFLNADRCLAGNSWIQLASGDLVLVKNLVGKGPTEVASVLGSLEPAKSEAVEARSNGVREVVDLHTSYPIPLRLTADHIVLTQRGWVFTGDLNEGDFVFSPPIDFGGGVSIGEDAAWILGAMAAEGECAFPKSVRFSNTDEEFFLEFRERAERLGVQLGKTTVDSRNDEHCYVVGLYSQERGGSGINGIKKDLWELGEWGKKSIEKVIPSSVLKAPIEEKAAFLNALFRGDGWCSDEGSFGRAGYGTSSRIMVEQLSQMLWSMGIRTVVRSRPSSTDVSVESYVVDFSCHETLKLIQVIGEYRKGLNYREVPQRQVKDRIPISYSWLRQHLKEHHGLSTHTAWTHYHIQLRPGNRKDCIGRRVLSSIAEKLEDPTLERLASPGMSWVEVQNVVPAGEEEVFDLTVPKTECFIANGLVVHNCRGIPADGIFIDEFQDILLDNVPVIEECASHSDWRLFTYSGTPKSLDGSLEHYHSKYSTQNEWAVPCRRHGTPKDAGSWHWNILDEDNIGKRGLICDKCGEFINPADDDAQWAALNPKPRVEKPFEGYRLPQLMVPWMEWDEILHKQRVYSRAKFYNEVLGRSYDSGTRPLTRQDMQDNCNPELSMRHYKKVAERYSGTVNVFMGIDWGGGEQSYTVVTLGGYMPWDPDKFTFFYMHRFEGPESEPTFQVKTIRDLVHDFNVSYIGVDHGGGHWPNDELVRLFGSHKIRKYQWLGNPKIKLRWDPLMSRFLCHRTEVLSDFFNAIKRRDVFRFPRWEEFDEPYAADFLNIFSEYNDRLRQNVYKHAPGCPDDSAHSAAYCFLVSFFHRKRADILLPNKEADRDHVYAPREVVD